MTIRAVDLSHPTPIEQPLLPSSTSPRSNKDRSPALDRVERENKNPMSVDGSIASPKRKISGEAAKRMANHRVGTRAAHEKSSALRRPGLRGPNRVDRQQEALTKDLRWDVKSFARQNPEGFDRSLQQIYGDKLTAADRARLAERAANGILPFPNIQFVPSEILQGADAAYAPTPVGSRLGTIYLSEAIRNDPERCRAALAEEFGHHLDHVFGGADTTGDEGRLFQIALAKKGALTTAELRAGRLLQDTGTITVGGRKIDVEFRSDPAARSYEAARAFTDADRRAGAEAILAKKVDDALIAKYASANAETVDGVKAYLEGEGVDYALARQIAENELFNTPLAQVIDAKTIEAHLLAQYLGKEVDGKPVTDLARVRAYLDSKNSSYQMAFAKTEAKLLAPAREDFLKSVTPRVPTKTHAAALLARLALAKVLPEGTTITTPLPSDVQKRVDADPVLSKATPPIKTYRALFENLVGDVDGDQRLDVDALQLKRFLPGVSQQQILQALEADPTKEELIRALEAVGFGGGLARAHGGRPFELSAPALFGLRGRSDIERTQQQLLLRTGMVFLDSNDDGKVSDNDAVFFVDQHGAISETSYAKLTPSLKTMVEYNIATARACEDYHGQSSKMAFPSYDSGTGSSDKEAVNTQLWRVSGAQGQISWELKTGKLPSEAVCDPFTGNGDEYTTECAHARTMMRLKGLHDYYVKKYGREQGSFRFNALFAKTGLDKQRAQSYLDDFATYQQNTGKGWSDYTQKMPPPKIAHSLEVSRHRVFGHGEALISPWQSVSGIEAGPGDPGYFHNHNVTIEGVKIGYVGENVIDLGYRNGQRRFWGHPGGIKGEESWQRELAHDEIKTTSMSEFAQYFDSKYVARSAARVSESRNDELQTQIDDLRADQPANWQEKVKMLEGRIGWWKALAEVRTAVAEGIDPDEVDEATRFFSNRGACSLADMENLVDTFTDAGLQRASEAFALLDSETQLALAVELGESDPADLDTEERAQAVLNHTLVQSGRLHPALAEEGLQATSSLNFAKRSSWLEPGGNMGSRKDFAAWLKTDDFSDWYEDQTGQEYKKTTDLDAMPQREVQRLVELAFPMTRGMKTIYAQVNRGTQKLSAQMAQFLKEGALPDAQYRNGSSNLPINP